MDYGCGISAAYLLGPDGFLQGLIRLNYSLINYIKTILPFVMKGYREIVAVVVFEFAKGGCTEAEGIFICIYVLV
jgi:hypothetical protein